MAKRRPKADWEAIEREYRAGLLSIREIAKRNDCSDTAIRKKARQEGWDRDLSSKVRAKVRTKLVRTKVRTPQPSENEIVETAAEEAFQVETLQRADISRYRNISNKLLDELEAQTDGAGVIDQAKLALEQSDMVGLATAVEKMTSLPERIRSFAQASTALKNYITLERQAYSLDDSSPPPGTNPDDDVTVNRILAAAVGLASNKTPTLPCMEKRARETVDE